MYLNVLLLSFAAVAFAQNAQSSCQCSTVQTCLQQKKEDFKTCKSKCTIPDAAKACFIKKENAIATLAPSAEPSNCLFASGLCVGGARFARQAPPQQPGNDEFNPNWGPVQIPELREYFECVKRCMPQPNQLLLSGGANRPPPSQPGMNGPPQWGNHGGPQDGSQHEGNRPPSMAAMFFGSLFDCLIESQCPIQPQAMGRIFESCKPDKSGGAAAQFKQMEQEFCLCIGDAYKTDIRCGSPQS